MPRSLPPVAFDFRAVPFNGALMNLDLTATSQGLATPLFSSPRLFPAALALLLVTMTCAPQSAPAANPAPAAKPHGLLLVANKGEHTLGIIDPVAGLQIATIPENGVTGHEVAASPDGRFAYVPIYGDSGVGAPGSNGHLIRSIDLTQRRVVDTLDLKRGLRPHCAVMNPRDGMLYVTTELDDSITIVNPHSMRVLGHVPTGQPQSHMLAITRDGKRGYTSNVGLGTVSVLDLVARKVVAIIPVSPKAQRISLSRDDRWAFTSDQTQPRLAVIDTTTNGVRSWVTLPGIGYGTAPTPDGRYLLICVLKVNKVAVLDLKTFTLTHVLDVPASPQEIVVAPDGASAYVSCDKSAQVAMLDLKTMTVARLIQAGAGADGLAWAPAPSR